ncbi:MAG TPA: hypothetical protein VK588_12605 [Chitinophagaceae bacterium]|nr:hypothetical protein [Chitinophagaceae bacterium]
MRNNTKLKALLFENDISISMRDSEIEMIVTNLNQNVSFIVNGNNISDLLNRALKHSNTFKNQDFGGTNIGPVNRQ